MSPVKTRESGPLQGWILVVCGWFAVMAPQVIAPVLPTLAQVFANTPHVDILVPFVATGTSLFVALCAPLFGAIGDRTSHRRILLVGAAGYGLAGTAPLWLPTLSLIAASRAIVGIAEAAALTSGTALIGQYFEGRQRERYLAWQTGTATAAAIGFNALAGLFGDVSWRLPFAIYAFALVLTPLIGFGLHDGQREVVRPEPLADRASDTRFPWSHLLPICLATAFGMTAFVLILVQTPFLLTARGLAAPHLIGLWSSASMMASPLGSLIYALLRSRPAFKLMLTFGFFSIGFFLMGLASTWPVTIVGATVAYLGAGMILPTTITWGLASLRPEQRGKGTGLWVTATFLGQFVGPFCVLGLEHFTNGSLPLAVVAYALACALASVLCMSGSILNRRATARHAM